MARSETIGLPVLIPRTKTFLSGTNPPYIFSYKRSWAWSYSCLAWESSTEWTRNSITSNRQTNSPLFAVIFCDIASGNLPHVLDTPVFRGVYLCVPLKQRAKRRPAKTKVESENKAFYMSLQVSIYTRSPDDVRG